MMVNLKCVLVIVLLECSRGVFAQGARNGSYAGFQLQKINVGHDLVNGTAFRSVWRYHCAWKGNVTFSTLLLYGSKAWTFPNQDVQLDLSYPDIRTNATGPLISMFDVILKIGGVHSEGYITSGGILQGFINLSFVFSNISSLEYELWLYGVPQWTVDIYDQLYSQPQDFC